jgi:hypothetical protein
MGNPSYNKMMASSASIMDCLDNKIKESEKTSSDLPEIRLYFCGKRTKAEAVSPAGLLTERATGLPVFC